MPSEIDFEEAENKPLTDWANEPTLSDLKVDLSDAKNDHDAHVGNVGVWLDNLNVEGAARVKAKKGKSQIVPKLIRKQAEWRYAALSEPFLSTQDVYNVSPRTAEDKKSAEQNQLMLNYQFNHQLDKVAFIDNYVRTAVNEGSVVIRPGWAYEEEQVMEDQPVYVYKLTPELLPFIQQIDELKKSNPAAFDQLDDETRESYKASMDQDRPLKATITGYEEVEVTKVIKNQPTVEICDYRNVIIDPTAQGDMNKARFVIYSFETSLSELKRDGKYTNLEKISLDTNSPLGDPDHSTPDNNSFDFKDDPRKKIVVYEYWGFWDIKGSGLVEPFVASWVGNTMIRMEESPYPDKKLPFIPVSYLPVKQSFNGEPDGSLLEDNQRVIGAVTRGMIDIMGRSANGQQGSRKDALDVPNRMKYVNGEDYEFNGNIDPRQAFHMHTYPEIPASAQIMLQMQNQEAESLTGVKAYNSGISGQALGDVAAGVRGALDAASKRELGILRRLSAGVIELGRRIIAMNSEFLEEEEVVRVTNDEFVPVRRDDLAGRIDLTLSISTAEEDNQKAQELSFMLQTVGPKVDPKITFDIMGDIAKLRKMPELAQRLKDYQPQPDPLAQEKAQLEVELLKAQIANEYAKAQENSANAQLDQVKAGNLQSQTDKINLDYVEQESGVTQERELQKQGAQARANQQLELTKAALAQGLNNKEAPVQPEPEVDIKNDVETEGEGEPLTNL